MIFEDNEISKNQCDFDFNQYNLDCVPETDTDSDVDNNYVSQPTQNSQDVGVISGKTCVICLNATSDVLLSCGHYKYCKSCYNIEKANFDAKVVAFNLGKLDVEPKHKCPYCNSVITGYLHLKKIFVD